jgi:hypothetical protein
MSATDNAPDPTTAPAATKDPNRAPAHALWVELSTRITTQRLHYRSGDEETAARSIYSLFGRTRELMEKNPDAVEFHTIAGQMLNTTIRSYTARWHGWMVPDPKLKDKDGQPLTKFADPQLRRAFRGELRELQPYLLGYQKAFNLMRLGEKQDQDGKTAEDWSKAKDGLLTDLNDECNSTDVNADLGDPIESGLLRQVWLEDRFPGSLKAKDIEKKERIFLNRRRTFAAGENTDPIQNAVGLALSGGGIKSATFCLGVVQELVKQGIFQKVDYISTVSGGGYFGSFLSSYLGTVKDKPETKESADQRAREALLPGEVQPDPEPQTAKDQKAEPEKEPKPEPDAAPTTASESEAPAQPTQKTKPPAFMEAKAVRHLRNHSKYLMHGGLFGKLNIAGLVGTGIVANLLMILPLPLFIALVLALLNFAGFWGSDIWTGKDFLPQWSSGAGHFFKWPGMLLAAFWIMMPYVQSKTNGSPLDGKGARVRGIWEFVTLMLAVVTVLTGLLYALPCVVKAYIGIKVWLHGKVQTFVPTEKTMTAIMGAVPVILGAFGFLVRTSWLRNLIMKSFVLSGPVFFAFIILSVSTKLGLGTDAHCPSDYAVPTLALGIIVVALFLWSLFFINLNTLALHRYYRARLCECYLAVPKAPQLTWWGRLRAQIWEGYVPDGEDEASFGTVQQAKLSEIGASGAAPYHLLNAIVNLPASKNRNLRGRGGDFFVMTRDYCGSAVTGYAETKRIEEADPRLDLGAAMAISAAAANTNMGWRTEGSMGAFRFFLTLLNVRLGYWIPNFRLSKEADKKLLPIPNKSVGSPYLLAELSGRIQENMNHLNVSDGGHIENLGVYELLRRKCKFIISADGGCNRDTVGGDLQRLERYAFIDFGITFEYDQAELQPDEEGIARAPAILVKIKYSDDEIGWMIYLRPSITGIEPAYTLDHWKLNPVFPYESILDQLFEEEQFEGYRSLGECAMASMFRKELETDPAPTTVEEWFQNLASNLLPDNDDAISITSKDSSSPKA